jgi:hypothetical protein
MANFVKDSYTKKFYVVRASQTMPLSAGLSLFIIFIFANYPWLDIKFGQTRSARM